MLQGYSGAAFFRNGTGMSVLPACKVKAAADFFPPEQEYSVGFFTGGERKMSGKELASLTVGLDHPGSVQIIRYEAVK